MVTFLSSSTLFTTLATPTWVLWLVTTSMASVGGSAPVWFCRFTALGINSTGFQKASVGSRLNLGSWLPLPLPPWGLRNFGVQLPILWYAHLAVKLAH